jgi:hypothetical protein
MGIARTWVIIGAPSQHEGIMEIWSIVIQVSSHHDWSNVSNTFNHSFAIMMINV